MRQYGYDAYGNRIFMENEGNRTDYYYNEANQLMRCSTGENVTDYFYDAKGNLIQINENGTLKQGYEYNCMNLMSRAVNGIGTVSSYEYNGLGQRVSQQIYEDGAAQYVDGMIRMDEKNCPTKSIEYILEHTRRYNNVLMCQEDNFVQEYVWDGNVAMESGTRGIHYFLQDELGSPLRYTNEIGGLEETYGFDEFGNDLLDNQESRQLFGYTGYCKDTVSGTYFAQAREYMAQTGRFASRDKVKGIKSSPYTINEYTYCWNRPLNFVDKNGAFPSLKEIRDGFCDVCEDVGDWLGDTVNSAGEYISYGTEKVFSSLDYAWDNYVPEVIQDGVKKVGQYGLGALRTITEIDIIPGTSISDIMADFSQSWIGEAFLDAVCFERIDGIYHADQNCWQKPFGYNDFYDYVFDGFTSMDVGKYPFTLEDGTSYTIWMWKGDYYNLGAGCETGIYYGNEGDYHWNSADNTNLYMSLALYDKKNGKWIFNYNPTDPQWWITGFNPKEQDRKAEDLEVHGSIDFSQNPDMWDAFYGEYKGEKGWCFDEENKTAYYVW